MGFSYTESKTKIFIVDRKCQPARAKDEAIHIMSMYYTLGTWDIDGIPDYLEGIDDMGDIVDRASRTLPRGASQFPLINGDGAGRTDCVLIRTDEKDFTGAEVHATFLFSDGTANNSFGYFIYDLNDGLDVPSELVGGVWTPLPYTARNNVDIDGKSVLKKTIVFPKARSQSDPQTAYYTEATGGQMVLGQKVKLYYDTNDLTKLFPNNTGIGFFIVPNGWDDVNKVVDENIEAIYTYSKFNSALGVRSSLFFTDLAGSTDVLGRYVVAFEDNLPTSSNCTNVVVAITVNPRKSVVRYIRDLIFNLNETPTSSKFWVDNTGAHIKFDSSALLSYRIAEDTTYYVFELWFTSTTLQEFQDLHTLISNMDIPSVAGGVIAIYSSTKTVAFITNVYQKDMQRSIYVFDILPNLRKKSVLNGNITAWDDFVARTNQAQISLYESSDSPNLASGGGPFNKQIEYINTSYDPFSYICDGCWDANYVPNYLDSIDEVDGVLLRLLKRLPSDGSVPDNEPYYLTNEGYRSIIIQSSDPGFTGADVYVTSLYSAVYDPQIMFGYVVFPLNGGYTVPTKMGDFGWVPMNILEIQELDGSNNYILPHIIVFPKTETKSTHWTVQLNAYPPTMTPTGSLEPGSTVRLVYDLNNPSSQFPNNYGIMFFLYIKYDGSIFYTGVEYPNLSSLKSLLFYDRMDSTELTGRYIISFANLYGAYSFFFNNYLVRVTPRSSFNVDVNPVLDETTLPANDDTVLTNTESHSVSLSQSTIFQIISSTNNRMQATTMTTNSSGCNSIQIKNTINSSNQSFLSDLTSVTAAMNLSYGSQVISGPGKLTFQLTTNRSNIHENMPFVNRVDNLIPSPINPSKSRWDSFRDLYVGQKFQITSEQLSIDVCDNTTIGGFITQIEKPVAPKFRTSDKIEKGIPNQYYIGYIRYFDNGETIINVRTEHHPDDLLQENETVVRYVAIRHNLKHLVIDMLQPGNYYQWTSGLLIPSVPDPLVFTLLMPQDIPFISTKRVEFFDNSIGQNNYELRYVSVLSLEYQVVYIELLYAPFLPSVINQINIISDAILLTNQYMARTIKNRALNISDLLA